MRFSVVLDTTDPAAILPFWEAALGYQRAWEDTDFIVLVPSDGEPEGPPFLLQRVKEPKSGKNRSHVDIHPPLALGVPALVDRLKALGGRRLGPPDTHLLDEIGVWWQTMADPEGNEFDVVADEGHPPPGAPE